MTYEFNDDDWFIDKNGNEIRFISFKKILHYPSHNKSQTKQYLTISKKHKHQFAEFLKECFEALSDIGIEHPNGHGENP